MEHLGLKLDDESARRLLAIRKKLFLSKTAAVKLSLLNLYNQEVESPGPLIPASVVDQHVQDLYALPITDATGKPSADLHNLLSTIA